MRIQSFALALSSLCIFCASLFGCGAGSPASTGTKGGTLTAAGKGKASGRLYGGQQPIIGSKVYFYAANTTATAGAATSLLPAPGYVTTDSSGTFTFDTWTCPSASSQVYLVALGGDAGSGNNAAAAIMAAIGNCSSVTASSFYQLNELTTAAAASALSAFMTDATHIGATAANVNSMVGAFASAGNMVSITSGAALTLTAPGNGTVPQATINSLGNTLASCVNSDGTTACSNLFSAAAANGMTPTDTVQAALLIAQNPTHNSATLYGLAQPQSPFQPSLSSAPASFSITPAFPSDFLTFYANSARTGVQSAETILTPANVNSTTFGKLRSFPVDGYLFAQPLYVGGLGMPDGAVHDVVYASSLHGTVFAFDADGNNPAQGYLWSQSLIPTGETTVTPADYFNCSNPSPESALLSTPVIDRSTQTLYALVKTKITSNSSYVQRLHAISLLDGTEKFGGPVVISASVAGTGDGSSGGVVSFDALHENERSALLLANGTVWIAWASHCDVGPYHGWIMGYNAASLAQTAVFNNTPNGSDGGIWMSQGGPAVDAQGYIYTVSGNGTFDGSDYGDAGVKLAPPSSGSTTPTVADYFVPSNQQSLSNADLDVGVSQPLLFDDAASGTAPHLMIESDKTGRVYLLNTANMGHYDTGTHGPDSLNGDVQDFTTAGYIFNNFAFFNNTLYLNPSSAALAAYTFTPGTSSTAGSFPTSPTAQTSFIPAGGGTTGGSSPIVSANGTSNGIVWMVSHGDTNSTLYAVSASNVATELYDSTQAAGSRDLGPLAVKFTAATVANGKVFVGGQNSVVVYGLLP